jgi:hypothetical protein
MGLTNIQKRALKGGTSLPDLSEFPVWVPRVAGAKLVTDHYFQISPRTLERWPLAWRLLNGRAHCTTAELFAEAERRLASAPVVMGGRKAAA